MRLFLIGLLLPIGCNNAADARYIAQFRENGIRACISGESVMRPHWGVPPDRLEQTCNCIVDAYMEGHNRAELQHPTITDQMRARDRCSGGAPEGAGPADIAAAQAMDEIANEAIAGATGQANQSGAKK